MVTRLYGIANSTAPVSPGFDGNWQATTGAVRRWLAGFKEAPTETRAGVAVTSGANNETLGFQLVSAPLDGAQTITGTVTIMTRGRMLAANDGINRRARGIRVVSRDGSTVRGTLLAQGFDGTNTGSLATSLAGYQAANATSLSSVSAQDGDRIVVELGYGMSSTGTSPQYDMLIGGNGTDESNADGTATGTVPWVEFSQNLTFKTVPIPVNAADLAEGSGTRSFAAVTTQAGDDLVVGIQVEDGATSDSYPVGATGLTFAAGADSGTPGNSRGRAIISTAADATGASRTVTITPGGGGGKNYRARLTVVRNSTGVGGTGATSTGQTVSVARQGPNSMMFYGITDWSAGAVGTPVWTPDGVTTASQQGTSATYIFGRWDDSGAAGTASHGISSPSYTTPAVAVLEMLGPASSGQTVAVGQVSETDTAQAVSRSKVRTAGQPAETDLAQPVARTKRLAAGQPAETDTAQPVGRQKVRTLGIAAETDLAQPVTAPGPITVAVGQATEVGTAQPVGRIKSQPAGQASETDLAQPVGRIERKATGQPSEVDTALAATRIHSRTLGQPVETNLAQPVARRKVRILGQAIETDLAQPVTRPGVVPPIGQAVETDLAQPVRRVKVRAVGQALETDAGFAIARRKTRSVGETLETDTAQALARQKTRVVGPAATAELAQPLRRIHLRTLGQPTETDLAQHISTPGHHVDVGQAVELDVALPIRIRLIVRRPAGTTVARPTGPGVARPGGDLVLRP